MDIEGLRSGLDSVDIQRAIDSVTPGIPIVQQEDTAKGPDYFTIEGMRSQEYSVGIFFFLVAGVIVFAAIIARFLWSARKEKSGLKIGEKLMFLWIILGTIVAVGFGALQLLHGQLF